MENETMENKTVEKEENQDKKKFRINLHLVFVLVILLCIGVLVSKFIGFGQRVTKEDIDAVSVPDNPEIEVYDYFVPVMAEDDGTFPTDDGITTVVCLGNSPFSDDRASKDNVCSLLAEQTGATVYNCSIPDSYLSSYNYTFLSDYPMDAFSFYWLTTIFAADNQKIIEQAYNAMDEVPSDLKEAVDLLKSIDFNAVDAIVLMYDAADYFNGRPMYSDENETDIQCFTGAMTAGIELIKAKFPWIRVIVMSPSYAFGVAEDGSYVSSDIKTYGQHYLSTYFNKQFQAAYSLEVTFVDNLYGSFHEDNARDYLKDNVHLNQKGRERIASRIKEALERYTPLH